ncbi:DUF2442 domain-containing protein [Ningiella sp. W23]|uniref:DUF2442 domain-containing protein n=1 Tax=Ningiella sp. W23 TaxID=3023715 RepID=UPI0037573908
MSILAVEQHALASSISFTEDSLVAELVDGRVVSVPLIWFPRLSRASSKELETWELLGDGEGIHWPLLDEDLSVAGLLMGNSSIRG